MAHSTMAYLIRFALINTNKFQIEIKKIFPFEPAGEWFYNIFISLTKLKHTVCHNSLLEAGRTVRSLQILK